MDADSTEVHVPRGRGLRIASVSTGSVGLVLAASTWAAWLLVRPEMPSYLWITPVFVLVLGALWFAAMPVGVLAIIFGMFAGARLGRDTTAVVGAYLGLLTIAVAGAGAAAFVFGNGVWTEPPLRPLTP